MQKILLKFINILLILAAIGLGLWLVNKNFPAVNQMEVLAILGQDTPIISRLGPEPRLKLDYPHQLILASPVYFDLRTVSWFKRARIQLVYREEGRTLVSLAGKTGEPWQYQTFTPLVILEVENDWQQAIFEVDLTSLYSPKNVRRFLIDTQGVEGKVLRVKEIKIILER